MTTAGGARRVLDDSQRRRATPSIRNFVQRCRLSAGSNSLKATGCRAHPDTEARKLLRPNFNIGSGTGLSLPIPPWARTAIAYIAIGIVTILSGAILITGAALMILVDILTAWITIGSATRQGGTALFGGSDLWGIGVGVCLVLAYMYMTKLVSSRQFMQHVDTVFEKAILVAFFLAIIAGKALLAFSAWTYLMFGQSTWNVLPASQFVTPLYIVTSTLTLAFSILAPWIVRKGLKLITEP